MVSSFALFFMFPFSGVGLVGVFVITANKLVIDISHNSSRACTCSISSLSISSSSVEGVAESMSERSSVSDCYDRFHVALEAM